MNIPAELKYSNDHEWVKAEGNVATIGITEYAQGELGDIVFVDIDSDLAEITFGEVFGSIEAVKTVSDLLAPCNGKVMEINPEFEDNPEIINEDPYGKGWLIKVEMSDPSELDNLMDAEAYGKFIGQ
ncbi:MAG: glycine cleavage system protein GcvH [Chlorobi bacterium]|nr:glycine cleavage system protein GcvH [Chlorobiota bacterium]